MHYIVVFFQSVFYFNFPILIWILFVSSFRGLRFSIIIIFSVNSKSVGNAGYGQTGYGSVNNGYGNVPSYNGICLFIYFVFW